jgi:hypothetical protein
MSAYLRERLDRAMERETERRGLAARHEAERLAAEEAAWRNEIVVDIDADLPRARRRPVVRALAAIGNLLLALLGGVVRTTVLVVKVSAWIVAGIATLTLLALFGSMLGVRSEW